MEWMLDIQLGRRNLSPIQRIAVAEKYRPIYEKQAKENQSLGGGDKKSENYKKRLRKIYHKRNEIRQLQKNLLILLAYQKKPIVWVQKF